MKIAPDIVEKIRTKALTNRAAAKQLGISESYLSFCLTKQGYRRERSPHIAKRKERHELKTMKKQLLETLAAAVKRKAKTIAQAAAEGQCSERTIYRILDTL